MGKVFLSQELFEGQLPKPGAHAEAATFLLNSLQENYLAHFDEAEPDPANAVFDGAMVYGSIAQGSATRRSDLDILITYSGDTPADQVIDGYRSLFQDIEARWHVPVEPNIWHTEALSSGRHTMDAAFLEHLRTVREPWLIAHPLDGVVVNETDYGVIFRQYCAHKIRSFTKALGDTTEELNTHHMQRALELPASLGRKALSTLAQIDTSIITPGGMTKVQVSEHINKISCPNSQTARLFAELCQTDAAYTDLLEGTIRGSLRPLDYEGKLNSLYRPALGLALRLTEALGTFVMTQLEQAK